MIFVCAHGDLFAEGVTDGCSTRSSPSWRSPAAHLPGADEAAGADAGLLLHAAHRRSRLMHEPLVERLRHRSPREARAWRSTTSTAGPSRTSGSASPRGPAPRRRAHPGPARHAGGRPLGLGRAAARADRLQRSRWLRVTRPCMTTARRCKTAEMLHRRAVGRAELRSAGLDWIVAGGESGPGARPMHPDWARCDPRPMRRRRRAVPLQAMGRVGNGEAKAERTPGQFAIATLGPAATSCRRWCR